MDKTKTRARITVKVQPRAKKTELAGKVGETYRLRLAAPPVDGKANQACVRFFADRLGVPQSAIRVAHGLTGRLKVVEIEGINPAEVERVLADEY